MKWFRDLKVGKKLLLGVSVVIVCIGIITVAANSPASIQRQYLIPPLLANSTCRPQARRTSSECVTT